MFIIRLFLTIVFLLSTSYANDSLSKLDKAIEELEKELKLNSLQSGSFIFGINNYISDDDYNKAIKEYVNKKYPNKVKQYNQYQQELENQRIEEEKQKLLAQQIRQEEIRLAKIKKEKEDKKRKKLLKRKTLLDLRNDIRWEKRPRLKYLPYYDASDYCNSLNTADLEWRLPTVDELVLIRSTKNKLGPRLKGKVLWSSDEREDYGFSDIMYVKVVAWIIDYGIQEKMVAPGFDDRAYTICVTDDLE
jgi:hypothetical protein